MRALFWLMLVLLSTLSCCALNSKSDADIRLAIRLAIQDGLDSIDQYLRQHYWQYLEHCTLVHYNTLVKQSLLNYRIIYRFEKNLFRANCDITKDKWKVHLNSLVRLSNQLVDEIDRADYQ